MMEPCDVLGAMTGVFAVVCCWLSAVFPTHLSPVMAASVNMTRQDVLEILIVNSSTYNARIAPDYEQVVVVFRNEKKGEFHIVTVPNRLMHLYRNGTIYYSMSLFDSLCGLPVCTTEGGDGYGYTTENIIYRWIDHKPIDYQDNLQLSQYTLVGESLDNCTKTYKETGSFSCVRADFILKRDVGFYIIQVYVPSVLIVILSWVSFWLDIEAIPARISLGVLTVLTMTTQSSGARSSLPRVSYVKAIDVWMATCLFFVFASLLEFAYINVLARRRMPYQCFGTPESMETSPGANGSHHSRTDGDRTEKHRLARQNSQAVRFYGKSGARYCDRMARFVFPLAFVMFNMTYWLIYVFVEFD
ncbi:gluClAc2 [Aplysia californica]|uniref:GluClAc2 n=1 Tax=Aplysia californica TaxID=6500 RepID=A0ABM1VUH9_APLCA|nr:gluClAc2 [Aplysia californica]